MEWPDSTVITLAILPFLWESTNSVRRRKIIVNKSKWNFVNIYESIIYGRNLFVIQDNSDQKIIVPFNIIFYYY